MIAVLTTVILLLVLFQQLFSWPQSFPGPVSRESEIMTGGQNASTDQTLESRSKSATTAVGGPESSTPYAPNGIPGIDQKLIKTADIKVKVKEGAFQHAFDRASAIAAAAGGYVTSSNSTATDSELKSGSLIIRVPAEKFVTTLNSLKKLGEPQELIVSGQDVTEEYVDIESRLKNLKAQEALLLKLLDKAKTVEESIAVERRLSEVQSEIEVLTGRKRLIDNQTDYSTINVYIFEPSVEQTKIDWGIIETFRQAALAFVRTLGGLIVTVGALGPILIVVIAIGYWAVRRRRRQKQE